MFHTRLRRSPAMVELEQDMADVPIWFTLWAPAGVPKAIAQQLNDKIRELAATEEMKEKLRLAGAAPVIQTIDEIVKFREEDSKAMAELIKLADIKIE